MSDKSLKETKVIRYSVIIPVYNEAESLPELYRQLHAALFHMNEPYEIIFIDDGSEDRSSLILSDLIQKDKHLKVISFYNNYGKSAAYVAGFKASCGIYIFTLDSDLQDIPSEMTKLLDGINKGNDLVIGWKQKRINNEPLKKIPSILYNYLKFKLFGLKLHDSNSGFRCMHRDVAMSLKLYGDRYRFIPELAHLRGFRVVEVPTLHRSRQFGKSKYGGGRFLTGLLDLLSVRYLSFYFSKPLQFFGSVALFFIAIGSILEFYIIIEKISGSSFQTHVAALIVGVLFIIMGFIFLSIGLLGEMLSAHNEHSHFAIRSKQGFE